MSAIPSYHFPAGGPYPRRASVVRTPDPALTRLPPGLQGVRGLPAVLNGNEKNNYHFDPKHLACWTMPEELWNDLGASMRRVLQGFQKTGAIMQSCLERIEMLDAKRNQNDPPPLSSDDIPEMLANQILEDEARSRSRAASGAIVRPTYDCSPYPAAKLKASSFGSNIATPSTSASSGTNSTTPASPSEVMTPSSPMGSFSTPIDPLDIGVARLNFSRRESETSLSRTSFPRRGSELPSRTDSLASRRSSSTHTVYTQQPRERTSIQYFAELQFLSREIIPRITKEIRDIEEQWAISKRLNYTPNDEPTLVQTEQVCENEFNDYWAEKLARVHAIIAQSEKLSKGVRFSLDWSEPIVDDEEEE